MPWPVYSHRLCYSEVADGWHQYRVPEGMRAIITSILAANISVAGAAAKVNAHGILIAQLVFPASTYTLSFATYAVVYGGELIECFVDRAGVTVYVSGYILEDPKHESYPPPYAGQLPAPITPPDVVAPRE